MTTPGTNTAENYFSHSTDENITLLMSVLKQQYATTPVAMNSSG